MSPAGQDPDDPRRAISPSNARGVKPAANGVAVQPFPVNGARKPARPTREDDEGLGYGQDEGDAYASASEGGPVNQRALSPTAARAASPGAQGQGQGQQAPAQHANVASLMMSVNGPRSASPHVDRARSAEGYYPANGASPTANGFASPGGASAPAVAAGAGSTGNVTADLIRDLKAKEAEAEAMRKRGAWMRVALAKAARAGFIYADVDAADGPADGGAGAGVEEPRVAEVVVSLKQLRARIQVRVHRLLARACFAQTG